ncbi:arylesterase [Tardiphaga sp. vice154]|uniref:arylesterase n=1 Tax=Tardiphaga sp. vice154 TaxID=2592814 RepID=UPI001161FED5|nr:arylesterase [Tardiphaga sp. vice154]QDM20045.1 arylesterase [Tardiphaga sp. vice154]
MQASYGTWRRRVEGLSCTFAWLIAAGLVLSAPIAPAAAQDAAAKPVRLVVLGDSLSAGYGLPANAAFPVRLQAALKDKGTAVEVINAGVSGDTTSSGLGRLDWSVPDGTKGVILELGANDALRGIDPKVPREALSEIIRRLQARKIAVLLAGMVAPPNYGADYAQKFNSIYPDLAKQFGVPLYPFFLEGVAGNTKLALPDGMHPTTEGIDIVVKNILPSVEAFIGSIPKQPG